MGNTYISLPDALRLGAFDRSIPIKDLGHLLAGIPVEDGKLRLSDMQRAFGYFDATYEGPPGRPIAAAQAALRHPLRCSLSDWLKSGEVPPDWQTGQLMRELDEAIDDADGEIIWPSGLPAWAHGTYQIPDVSIRREQGYYQFCFTDSPEDAQSIKPDNLHRNTATQAIAWFRGARVDLRMCMTYLLQ